VEWNVNSFALEEWSRLFMLVNNSMAEGPTSVANLEVKEEFASKAAAHRTPGKRKAESAQPPLSLRASPYMRQINVSRDDENPFSLSSAEALEVLKQMDEGLEKVTNNLWELSEEHGSWEREGHLAIGALEHKNDDLKREIGSRPEALSLEYNAPTMWGSIGAIGSHVDVLAKSMSDPKLLVKVEVGRVMDPFKDQLLGAVSKKTSALDGRINKIKTFVLKTAKHLQECIDEKGLDEDLDFPPMSPANKTKEAAKAEFIKDADHPKPEWVEDVIKSFETRIEDLSTRMSRVTAETDEQAVRFAGLGFRTSREANAWLVMHMPAHHCGLIVDVHTVMEHIQVQSFGQDSIKTLESLIKLKIKTMADGLAMTSFEQKMPRFFKKATSHKVIKDDASHFDTIASFDEWDAPGSGFRVQLKEELVTFRAAHLENIDNALERDSIAYAVATMALTESVSWIEGFVVFLDDYHRDLTKAKFGTKKAWHVATRLGKRILEEIAHPRNGVSNSFEAGNNEQVCQRILWAVLRTHDIMARYKRNGYKDDPTVSAELVKFMAVNTGFEALEVLAAKVKTMETEVTVAKREAMAATKAAASSANKTDELKKAFDLVLKRVAKLESR
jgi:hypothetical protein